MLDTNRGALVDLGNVIIAHWLTDITPETFHTIDYNSIPEVPGAFEGLAKLCDACAGNVMVVYHATHVADEKIRRWLMHRDFARKTGVPLDRVVRSTTGRNKAETAAKYFDAARPVQVVIDDRLEVLNHFLGTVPELFLFRPVAAEVCAFNTRAQLDQVHVVETWTEIVRTLGL